MKSNQINATLIVATLILAVVAYQFPAIGWLAVIIAALVAFLLLKPKSQQSNVSVNANVSTRPSDPANSHTLYVGNLPYRANEKDVRELFAQHGQVFNVRLMKDKRTGKRRGFGFVVVLDKDADKMIAALNEYEYMQRTLKVRVANDPKHPAEDKAE